MFSQACIIPSVPDGGVLGKGGGGMHGKGGMCNKESMYGKGGHS